MAGVCLLYTSSQGILVQFVGRGWGFPAGHIGHGGKIFCLFCFGIAAVSYTHLINAVILNGALLDIIEAVDEVGDGGFACAGGTDEGDLLAWTAI